jgi:hypothetical protein
MPRRKRTPAGVPPEIPAAPQVEADEAIEQITPEMVLEAEPIAPLQPEDDGAALGYSYPADAVGAVVTLRDFGSHRICTDQTGRKLRQYRG